MNDSRHATAGHQQPTFCLVNALVTETDRDFRIIPGIPIDSYRRKLNSKRFNRFSAGCVEQVDDTVQASRSKKHHRPSRRLLRTPASDMGSNHQVDTINLKEKQRIYQVTLVIHCV